MHCSVERINLPAGLWTALSETPYLGTPYLGVLDDDIIEDVGIEVGDILGSGPISSGYLLETTNGKGPWLQPGDIVELEIEKLGVLVNTVGERK